MSIQGLGKGFQLKTEETKPLEEDAMDLDAPVSTAAKRAFDEMNRGGTPPEESLRKKARKEGPDSGASELKFTKFERWALAKTNGLMRLLPSHAHTSDPYRLIFIDVQVKEGEWMEFKVPLMVLFQLSDHFRREFSYPMKESETLRIKWVGPGCDPDLHPQAVAQVLMYGHKRAVVFDEDQCRTLKQLKDNFPEEYKVILSDIVRLSNYFEIEDLSEEVAIFIAEELSSDMKTHFPWYFEWALQNEESSSLFLFAIKEIGQEDYSKLYSHLISFFNADYSACDHEQVLCAHRLLRQSFETALDEEKDKEKVDSDRVAMICRCFVELYPHWEFDEDIIYKVYSIASDKDERSPLVYYVSLICDCYVNYLSRLDDFRNLNKVKRTRVMDLDHRPKVEGKLKAYELFLQGMAMNPPNLDEFLAQYPHHIFAMKLRAWMHAKSRNYPAALVVLEKIIAQVPGNEQAIRARGVCRWKISDHAGALEDFQTLTSLYPKSGLNFLLKAEVHREMLNFDAAFEAIETVLRIEINHHVYRADAFSMKGECLDYKGDGEGALAQYNLALLEIPTHLNSLLGLSRYYLRKQKLDEAKHVLDKALESSPGSAKVFALRGQYYFAKGDLEASLIALDKSLSIEPTHFALVLKAEIFHKKGHVEEALKHLEKATQLSPNEPYALFVKGTFMQRVEKYEAAIECFSRAIQLKFKPVLALKFRAECYQSLGANDAALRDCDRILELKPDWQEISSMKEKLLKTNQ